MMSPGAFEILVRLAEPFREGVGESVVITTPIQNLGELLAELELKVPRFSEIYDESYVFAVNGDLVLWGVKATAVKSGDEVEIMLALSGG